MCLVGGVKMSVQVLGQSGNVKVLPFIQNPNQLATAISSQPVNDKDVIYLRTEPKSLLGVGLQGGLAMTQLTNTNNIMNRITKQFADDGHPEYKCVWVRTSGIRPNFNTVFDYTVEAAVVNTSTFNAGIAQLNGVGITPLSISLTTVAIIAIVAVAIAIIIALAVFVWKFAYIAQEVWEEIKSGWENLPEWAQSGLTIGLVAAVIVGIIILVIGISGIGVNVSKKGVSTTSSKRKLGVKTKYGSVNV